MTTIEWTQETWNPLVGCSKISEGCRNCYAINQAYRNWSMAQALPENKRGRLAYYEGLTEKRGDRVEWTGKVEFVPEALEIPLKRKKPTTYFVNSMSDLFHESVPFEWVDKAFAVMAMCPQHTFQVLTKRPERMLEYFTGDRNRSRWIIHAGLELLREEGNPLNWKYGVKKFDANLPLPNVWLGTTVENQAIADKRVPLLLQTPAAVRFLSCEPLLEEIWFPPEFGWFNCPDCGEMTEHSGCGSTFCDHCGAELEDFRKPDWCIIGGESGHGARECHIDWVRSLVQQCQSANVPVFVKQLGSKPMGLLRDGVFPRIEGDKTLWKLRDRKGGEIKEWPEDVQVRELPAAHTGAIAEVSR